MRHLARRRVVCLLCALGGLLSGCGGGGGGGNPSPTPTAAAQTTPVRFSVDWGQRGRAVSGPGSALSATLVLTGASEDGSDFTYTINRDTANPAAFVQAVTTPNAARPGSWQMRFRFHADADGQGAVVGVAEAPVTLQSDGTGIGDIAAQNTVRSVVVTNGQSVAVGTRKDLAFSCRAGDGSLVAVSPGSAVYRVVTGANALQISGGQVQALRGGEASVRVSATVDGVASASAEVLVTGGDNPGVAVKDGVVLLVQDGSLSLEAQSDGSLLLSGNVPVLTPGAVLISGQGSGFIRRVSSVAPGPNASVRVLTTLGTLADVFSRLDVSFDKTFAASDFSPTPVLPGVSAVENQTASAAFHFENAPLDEAPQNPAQPRAVVMSGDVSLRVSAQMRLLLDTSGVVSVRSLPRIAATYGVTLTGFDRHTQTRDLKFAALPANPFTVQAGQIPLVFAPTLALYTRLDGTVVAGETQTASRTVTVAAGSQFSRGSGWSPLGDSSQTAGFAAVPGSYAEVSSGWTPVRAEMTLFICGVAGPFMETQTPRIEAQFTPLLNPSQVEITAFAVLKGGAGFNADILGIAGQPGSLIVNERVPVYDRRVPFAGGANVVVQ